MRRPAYWMLRDWLSPARRRQVRGLADAVLARVVGSVRAGRPQGTVAITLDDGPEPSVTPGLLALLDQERVRCTFFLLTAQTSRHPELARAIAAAGHEIALHGADHRRITGLPFREAVGYLRQARRDLEEVTGATVTSYRPPYGSQSLRSYLAARRAGLQVVVWSADAADWEDRGIAEVAELGLSRLHDGGILLLHERLEPDPLRGAPETTFDRVDLVRRVLAEVGRRGWRATTVAEVIRGGRDRTAWFRP